jgi:hypothetical protein
VKKNLFSLPIITRGAVAGALACSCWATAIARAADAKEAEAKEAFNPEEARNWIEIGGGGVFRSSGDDAAMRQRLQLPAGGFGGIEDFHYEQDLAKKGLLKIDGHGFAGSDDYGIKFDISRPELGYVQFGYSQFRTFYDGSGGYFPRNAQWFRLYDEEFDIARGEVWFEAGLRKPELPEITIRYSHEYRDGLKDSTSWGDSNLTGLAGATATRNIVPSFLNINERRHNVRVDARHTVGNSDVGVGVRYEFSDQDNSRNMRRRALETGPSPAGAGTSIDRFLTHREGVKTDMLNFHAFSETRVKESLLFTTGYSFTTLDTDIGGSRIFGSSYEAIYDPLAANRQARDEGFRSLSGGAQMHQHVGNLNFMWTPLKDLAVVTGVRIEKQEMDAENDYFETTVGNAPGYVSTGEDVRINSDRGILDVSESIELRYTGITNVVTYARASWMQGQGDLSEIERVGLPGTTDLLRSTEFDRSAQQYTAGLNWYPHRKVSTGAQYYHKVRNEDYGHTQDTTPNRTGNRYPAFLIAQDFTTDDVNFRVTFRPWSTLTLVSRYDLQFSTIDMQGDGLAKIESAEMTSHIFSQSVSWTPWSRLGLQATVTYAQDETDTPAYEATPAQQLVLDFSNDYWFANSTVTFVADDKTDISAYYSYYLADNYVNNSQFSQPFGAGAEEHTIGATLTRKLSERMRLKVRYGFFTYHDETSGGNNDFDGHLVYSSVQYLF